MAELANLVSMLNKKKERVKVFERAKEIATAQRDKLEVIADAVMHGARINGKELSLAMEALIIDPQYFYYKSTIVVTPIGFYLTKGYALDEIYALPGTLLIEGDELFLHPVVQEYHEYLFGYLLDTMGPGETALFTPCSKVKPYRDSFMYKKVEAIIDRYGNDTWRFIVGEPLAIVPRYFDLYYPAAHYDYPPEKVTEDEYEIYVNLVKKAIELIATKFERIIYTLPKKHKKVFEEALRRAQVEALYSPYNVYYFPRLREVLVSTASV
ncbi:hypothetical protein IPA_04880 [Ignicoccus pacificus DSM 13166]|uniref:DUF5591 domain-containing protein n=1 Tax=Ignicoccus pacificus DSM 13166 TaxID=940294 RepID=A0A977KB66_9CREN|nr:hypothetical protein IPA_04880 [Ignicoccus pacificus DSM 13166]